MKVIIFDTETTGLTLPSAAGANKQPRIIELGAILLNIEDGKAKKESVFSQLIDPRVTLEQKITKITGIKDSDLVGQPYFEDVEERLADLFEGVSMMIAHNAAFDVAMLMSELERAGTENFPMPRNIVCSVHEYRAFFGHDPKLTELYEMATGKPLAQTHRAVDDCEALLEALDALSFWDAIA